jgi:hypothetical protein
MLLNNLIYLILVNKLLFIYCLMSHLKIFHDKSFLNIFSKKLFFLYCIISCVFFVERYMNLIVKIVKLHHSYCTTIKLLSKNTRMISHLFVLSIANISCKVRYLDKGHCLLVVFLVIPSTTHYHKEHQKLFYSCIAYVLQPLKDISKR